MSLGEELKNKYMDSVCKSDEYKEELDRLKETLLKTAKTYNYYEVLKEEYQNIMSNKRMLKSWLDENELIYSGVGNHNEFISLTIEW